MRLVLCLLLLNSDCFLYLVVHAGNSLLECFMLSMHSSPAELSAHAAILLATITYALLSVTMLSAYSASDTVMDYNMYMSCL